MQTHNTLNNIHSSSLKLEALLLVFVSLTEYQVFTKLEELSTEQQPGTQRHENETKSEYKLRLQT